MAESKPEVFEVYRIKQDTLENVVLLTDYETLQAKNDALVKVLKQIERWDGFPSTNETWEGSGKPVSYSAAFGSNGERDFMRGVAKAALAAYCEHHESKR